MENQPTLYSLGPVTTGVRLNLSTRPLICLLAIMVVGNMQAQTESPPQPDLPGESPSPSLVDDRPAPDRKVVAVDVRFRGTAKVDAARIKGNMRLKEGETYTREKEEDDLRALYNTGDLLNASIDTVEVPGGVKVIVTADARPAMGDLIFKGNTVFNTERLIQEVEFKAGGVVDDTKLNAARAKILELYKKKGYGDTIVTYSVEPGAQAGFSRIVFSVDEGGRGVLNDIRFEGNTLFSGSKLKGITTSDNRNYLKFWDLKRKLDREKVELDMKAIEKYYGDRGYFDARVTGVDTANAGTDKVDLVFRILEGPQYTTAVVNVSGNRIFTTESFIPVFQLEAGTIFSLSDMVSDVNTIQRYYGSRGYAEAKVTPRIDKNGNNQLSVTYAVTEGSQFKVGKVDITGTERTRPEVVRRELAIDPEDEWNTIKIERSLNRIKGLDYFEDVYGVDFMPVSSALGPDYKDLRITVKEKETGAVQFGAGFSSVDSIVGMVEVTQKNFDITNWPSFTGGGQRFRLNLRAGTRRKDFLLSLTEPYFMGERLSLGGDLFWQEKTFLSDRFDQRDIGGSINLRKPVGDNTEWRLSYTLQNVEIYNMDEKASPELKSEEGKFLQSKVSSTFVYDTRNDIRQPKSGHKLSFETALSGGFLGGDVETFKVSLTGSKYWEIPWDCIFSVEGKLSSVDTFGGGERVPIFEREFLGGAYNLRGFDFRDVGPKDATGEPIGGQSSGYLSTEVTFPIMSKVRGAVFADAGFVNRGSFDFGTSDFNSDIGIGLRLVLPVLGPIKLDYGIPITSDKSNDSGGQFQFGVDFKY